MCLIFALYYQESGWVIKCCPLSDLLDTDTETNTDSTLILTLMPILIVTLILILILVVGLSRNNLTFVTIFFRNKGFYILQETACQCASHYVLSGGNPKRTFPYHIWDKRNENFQRQKK